MDILSRFGFHSTPFTREIATANRFSLPQFDEAVDGLERTVANRMSGALITPAGMGKTTVLRALKDRLPEARYRVHYVKVNDLSKREFCREIAETVGAQPAGTYPTLVRRLQDHFRHNVETDGLRPVLILDEAHDLRRDVLRIFRILTNFDMDSRLLLPIVLSGQNPLAESLKRPEFEDVARRISHYVTLRHLSREETGRYIDHRCNIAGAKTHPFDAGALDAIFEIGRGNLRATDRLAFKSLEIADIDNTAAVDANLVAKARKFVHP